jgi:CubicO group peptidase (beta-lactamase class C family)
MSSPRLSRRGFIAAASALAASSLTACGGRSTRPMTGTANAETAGLDAAFQAVHRRWNIPGGAAAVAQNGQLVYARGFGYADAQRRLAVSPTTLFRIASLAKPFTGVAIMQLVERGELSLDDKAFEILADLAPTRPIVDPRIASITVRNLLEHSGGWDSAVTGDPQFNYQILAAQAAGTPAPADGTAIIRYALGDRLDFAPGTRFAYSNLGFNVLGRILEHKTGAPYEAYVRAMLAPLGINAIRVGAALVPQPGETFYFDDFLQPPVYPGLPSEVPDAYGGFSLTAIDAHGGLIATAPTLARFLDNIDGTTPAALVSAETFASMMQRPTSYPPAASPYVGKAWFIDATLGGATHTGALTFGTASMLYRFPDGRSFAAVWNHLPKDLMGFFVDVTTSVVANIVRETTRWPSQDTYPIYLT